MTLENGIDFIMCIVINFIASIQFTYYYCSTSLIIVASFVYFSMLGG